MTNLRQAAEMALEVLAKVKYGLERNRVWGGMGWSYVPIHPTQYLPLVDDLEEQMSALHRALAEPEQPAFYVYEWVNPSDGVVFRSFRHDEHHMGRDPDRTIAVPDLHACAAPDLLEALEYVLNSLTDDDYSVAYAAIAKARGE